MMAEYIEQKALLKGIDEYHHTAHIQSITRETEEAKILWRGIHLGVNYCRNHILEAPTADVAEVRHGEWLLKHVGHGHYWECSVCHTNPCIYVTKDTKYCPNCGAKMDGKGESDA